MRIIYIAEAHAADEWPVGHPFDIPQHTDSPSRAEAAHRFREYYNIRAPMFIAPVNGAFEAAYKPWPFRFFVFEDHKIALSPSPIGESYNIGELWDYLEMKKKAKTGSEA